MLGDLHTLWARSQVDFKGRNFLPCQEKNQYVSLMFLNGKCHGLLHCGNITPPVPFTVKDQAFPGMLLVPVQTKSDAECRLVWPPVCNTFLEVFFPIFFPINHEKYFFQLSLAAKIFVSRLLSCYWKVAGQEVLHVIKLSAVMLLL